jgi:hypothetical protein
MDVAGEEREREKWNQRYLEGTHGTLPPDPLLLAAFDRYIEPLFPNAGHALDIAGGIGVPHGARGRACALQTGLRDSSEPSRRVSRKV